MSLQDEILELARKDPSIVSSVKEILGRYESNRHRPATERPCRAKVSFEETPLPDDFRMLIPGTHDWMRFWKENPEKQKDILAWQRQERIGASYR